MRSQQDAPIEIQIFF